jgi:predicted DNA-binding transcriptional regulator YafY
MRYEKADTLLKLALDMQASRQGLSLDDIQERFEVGRRTAMRLRDAIVRVFPQTDELLCDDRKKRWRIPNGTLDRIINFEADELADLETAVQVLKRENMDEQVASIEGISAKLQAIMDPKVARRVEPDLEALLEAEGLAMRPGPRPKIRTMVVSQLRQAIKASSVVTLHYKNRKTGKVNERTVHPYGFLHGHRNYLVGYHVHPKANNYVLFSLPNVEDVEIQSTYFERDPEFSLQAFAERSFGVYQEEPFEVEWLFSAKVADVAEEFEFHPGQKATKNPDGTLTVEFIAGGELEMAWHLYCWGTNVKVIKPERLKKLVSDTQKSWPGVI